jgi:hypothetical protein
VVVLVVLVVLVDVGMLHGAMGIMGNVLIVAGKKVIRVV